MKIFSPIVIDNSTLSGSFGNTNVDSRFTGSFSGSFANPVFNIQTGATYTLTPNDLKGGIIFNSGSGTILVTLPASITASAKTYDYIDFFQSGSGQVTVTTGSTDLRIVSSNGLKLRTQYSIGTLLALTSTQWVFFGDTTT